MRIELEGADEVDDFVIVEDGEHLMRVGGAKQMDGAEGRISWMLRMELVHGIRAGRTAVTEWVNFTPRGLHRARLILAALGFDVSDTLEVEPHELIGRKAYLRVATEETLREADQRVQRRSRVAYDGWSPVGDTAGDTAGDTVGDAAGGPATEAAEVAERPASGSAGGSFAADEMPF